MAALVRLAARLWPQRIGNQCLLMMVVGLLLGRGAPAAAAALAPLATLFLQISQVVVMPYLICELVVGFGGLSPGNMRSLLRGGLVVLLGLWLTAGALVTLLPPLLPPVEYSSFFHKGLFQEPAPTDLLRTFVPDNIFTALANDNFPAVVLFSSVLGVLMQGLEGRDQLLQTLELLRRLFARMNRATARIIPFGILALSALNSSRLELTQLVRMQGLLLLCLTALLLIGGLLTGLILAITPLTPAALWRIVRGPLAFTASSGNLLVALPLLVSALQEELPRARAALDGAGASPTAADRERVLELAPLVSLGYSLPGLGQVLSLLIVPFAGWYVNQPLGMGRTAAMLLTGIPTTVAGLKAVIRQELQRQGLPLTLLDLVVLNGEWLYRFEKVLNLLGLVVLAVLVYFLSGRALRWRPLPLLAGLTAALVSGGVAMAGGRQWLQHSLAGTYRNDEILLGLQPRIAGPPPAPLAASRREPVTMKTILRRGSLRVGLRDEAVPWSFRNSRGRLVGYDVDLLQTLARNLGVRLEVRVGPLAQLEAELDQQRLDLVAGGIQNSPGRALHHLVSRSYAAVHLALVVPDNKVGMVQRTGTGTAAPLRIAVADSQVLTPQLQQQLGEVLGEPQRPRAIRFEPLPERRQFFRAFGPEHYDALLTTAEGGAAWAVLHPETTLLAPFGDRFDSELVLLVGGRDPRFLAYLDSWLIREQGRGLMGELFDHWVLVDESEPQSNRSSP
jgi:proton glutamate symport protein